MPTMQPLHYLYGWHCNCWQSMSYATASKSNAINLDCSIASSLGSARLVADQGNDALAKNNMRQRINKLAKEPIESEIVFCDQQGDLSDAIGALQIGDWLPMDADSFQYHSAHAIAFNFGMAIQTKHHKYISAVIMLRIK